MFELQDHLNTPPTAPPDEAVEWELVTDVIEGRREILGWARKDHYVDYKNTSIEEWEALCMDEKCGCRPICIICFEYGWLPTDPRQIQLDDDPNLNPVKNAQRQLRAQQEIVEAADRYRRTFIERN